MGTAEISLQNSLKIVQSQGQHGQEFAGSVVGAVWAVGWHVRVCVCGLARPGCWLALMWENTLNSKVRQSGESEVNLGVGVGANNTGLWCLSCMQLTLI